LGKSVGRIFAGITTLGLSEVGRAIQPEPPKPPKMPAPAPLRELAPEEKELTTGAISQRAMQAKAGGGLQSPSYLGLDSAMSPFQQRTAIATKATSGDLGQDPGAFKYYRDLAFRTLTEPGASIQPVEQQYISSFGEPQRTNDTGGYLSAVERIYGRMK